MILGFKTLADYRWTKFALLLHTSHLNKPSTDYASLLCSNLKKHQLIALIKLVYLYIPTFHGIHLYCSMHSGSTQAPSTARHRIPLYKRPDIAQKPVTQLASLTFYL